MKDLWFSPKEITFQRDEMIFLLEYLEMLKCGEWPPHPGGRVEEPLIQGSRRHKAYFETPCQYAGEVEARLEKTKMDGMVLYWQIQAGITIYEDLMPEAKMALNYISGWRRRAMPYSLWKAQRKYKGTAR